ncbi:MAG: hypothetical protein ACSLFM_05820 [Tepidiformaceae bacterium]
MFGLKRRLLAVSLLAALGIAGAIGVSAGATYFYPTSGACTSTAYANAYRSGSTDYIYTWNAEYSCGTNVASKALYWLPSGGGFAETSWDIETTDSYASLQHANFDYAEGRGQLRTTSWGPVTYSGALYP